MAQTAAVRKTVKFPGAGTSLDEKCTKCGAAFGDHDGQRCPSTSPMTKTPVEVWFMKTTGRDPCPVCGHLGAAHDVVGHRVTCPDLPPAKQVTVDEAVLSKGGKPGFVKQLEDATGVTAANEVAAKAEANFNQVISEPDTEIFQARLSQLRPSPRNPRSALGDLKDLKASIGLPAGILSPLLVRELDDGTFEIVSGHRRYAAAVELELEHVPCIVRQLTELQALELNLTEQLQRKELTPLEEAKACRDLQELSGYDVKQIAAKLSQSERWVKGRLKMNDLAPEAMKLMRDGGLPIGAAVDLAILPHATQAAAVKRLVQRAKQEDDGEISTTQAVEVLHQGFSRPLKEAPFDTKREYVSVRAPACVKCPKNSACGERGLFDTFKADVPTCTDMPCWDKKTNADFEERAEKLAQEGAKILPRTEGVKLFNEYRNELNYGSEYVDGSAKPHDATKRTWAQLAEAVPEKYRPAPVVAQDHQGVLHKLYDAKELQKLATKHAGLKPPPKPSYDNSGHTAAYRAQRQKELAIEKQRDVVADQVLEAAVRKIALAGLTQADWELLAGDAVGTAFDAYEGIWRALGLLDKTTNQREAWVSKGASTKDLQAVVFGLLVERHFTRARDFEPEFIAMAKRYGCDPKAMMKAQAAGEKSEAAIDAKKKASRK